MSKGAESETIERRIIAIAMDASENAKYAYQYYLKNMRHENDQVFLLHTVELNASLNYTQWCDSPYTIGDDVIPGLLEEEREKIKQQLEQFSTLLKETGVNGTVKSIHAESPGEGICKAVEEINASIVVMGTRGMGKLRRTFMGSVSDYVIHHCHVPVLICRHNNPEQHHDKHK